MKKILLVLMSTLILTGCVSQTTTVTIDDKASATVEKKFSLGSTYTSADKLSKMVGDQFLEVVRTQNPESLMKYQTEKDSGYVAILKTENITKEDIFTKEQFFKPTNKKNLECKVSKNKTECKADFVVNIASPEIDKLLKDNGLTYQDLDPYTLVMKLPVQAESHNAKFFDLKNHVYIWEIPLGAPSSVNLKFTIK